MSRSAPFTAARSARARPPPRSQHLFLRASLVIEKWSACHRDVAGKSSKNELHCHFDNDMGILESQAIFLDRLSFYLHFI